MTDLTKNELMDEELDDVSGGLLLNMSVTKSKKKKATNADKKAKNTIWAGKNKDKQASNTLFNSQTTLKTTNLVYDSSKASDEFADVVDNEGGMKITGRNILC